MPLFQTIELYGSLESRIMAKTLLENLPHIRRIDTYSDQRILRLLADEPEKEKSLIPLLAQSGISGFRLM